MSEELSSTKTSELTRHRARGRPPRPPVRIWPVPAPTETDTRPKNVKKYYADGVKITRVLTNFFAVKTPTEYLFTNYHIDFEPNIEGSKLRKQLVYDLKDVLFDGQPFIFDGMSNIKTVAPKQDQDMCYTVDNPTDSEERVKITIRSGQEIPWGSPEVLRMFNTQMRRNLHHIGFVAMGRNFFDVTTKKDIPEHKIQLMQGVLTAINQHDGGLLMVVDTATKFIRSQTVLQALIEIRNQNRENWLDLAKKEICSSIVMTIYNHKTYKVDDIVTDETVETKNFEVDGQMMNLLGYYKQRWKIDIRAKSQPLIKCLPSKRDLRAGRTQPIMLVPELCQLTGLTDQMRSDFCLMKKVADVSRLNPKQRCDNLDAFIQKLITNDNVVRDLNELGMAFDTSLVAVDARELSDEKILMANDNPSDQNSGFPYPRRTGEFSREMRARSLYGRISIRAWMIIAPQSLQAMSQDLTQTLKKVAQPMGISLSQPKVHLIPDDRPGSYVQSIQKLRGTPCELVVTLVPNNNTERYAAIKKCCYIDLAMASQVIAKRTLTKKQMLPSIGTKIMIQMATKLGAEPWALHIPPKGLLVVGYDTYHDSLDRNRSVGAFVCSLNQTLTSWFSRTSFHNSTDSKQEMSSSFAADFAEGLKRYYFHNGKTLPKKIVIYRDGVSEGMIQHVYDFELAQIRQVLDGRYEDPPLAYIIVTRRVSARFFSSNKENPLPGTVIDRVVTRAKRYDFYLISQSVRQGTATPTMYNIIHDHTGLKACHQQTLAYKLTHLYYNWQGTVRVPAPCQYARKLAYLTGTALHRQHNDTLSERLFYL